MHLHRIILPTHTNDGRRNYAEAHKAFEGYCLDVAGGLTIHPASTGVWRNEAGRVYRETVVTYDVACSKGSVASLIAKAFDLFPDQEAIAYGLIGSLEIVGRPQ